jgi:hypothetical protein
MSRNRTSLPLLRFNAVNPNHHLWQNHGIWFLHYTAYPTPKTKERIRRSLGTKDVNIARERRDAFFQQLMSSQASPSRKTVAA